MGEGRKGEERETNVLVAFTAAETEEAGIVADEGDAFAGVARLRAEIARLDSLHTNQSVQVFNRIDKNPRILLHTSSWRLCWSCCFSLDSCKLLRLAPSKLSCQNLTLAGSDSAIKAGMC